MRLRWRATCHAVMVWCDESQNDESLRWAQETPDHGEQRLGGRMSVHQIGRRGFLKVVCAITGGVLIGIRVTVRQSRQPGNFLNT